MDLLLILEARETGLTLAVCTAELLSREASLRHGLASGSAAALAQALTSALLLAATERAVEAQARVDVQLECNGPLRGLLVDADALGAVRGLVRVNGVDRAGARVDNERAFDQVVEPASEPVFEPAFEPALEPAGAKPERFDARPVLSSRRDEKAGLLSVLRAQPGLDTLHRAAFPFAGANLVWPGLGA